MLSSFEPDARTPKGGYDPNGSVIIIGAGGIGFWLALAFSRMDEFDNRKIVVYDDDTLHGGNGYRRLPRTLSPSMYKVDLLAQHLSMFNSPQDTVKRFTFVKRKFSLFDISKLKARLVIDATDAKLDWRTVLYRDLEKRFIPFVRCSYDGTVVTFSRSVPLSISNDGGYNLVPNMGVSLAAAGICAEKIRRIIVGENVPNEDYHFGNVWYPEHPQEDMIEGIIERARPENAPVYDEHGVQIGVASDFYDFEVEDEEAQEILEGEEAWTEERLAAVNDEQEFVELHDAALVDEVPLDNIPSLSDVAALMNNETADSILRGIANSTSAIGLAGFLRTIGEEALANDNDLPVLVEDSLSPMDEMAARLIVRSAMDDNAEIPGDYNVSNT